MLPFWQTKEHELDFVAERDLFIEVKRGRTGPLDFAWFERVLPRGRLLVVGDERFDGRSVRGRTMEDFLREEDLR